jgi:selenocysteine-specific translation elongation factor
MDEIFIGEVTHYFNKIGVAVLNLSGEIRVGDEIHVTGYTTDFHQEVTSLQIEHQDVDEAHPGDDVALKVIERVRHGDQVFKTP